MNNFVPWFYAKPGRKLLSLATEQMLLTRQQLRIALAVAALFKPRIRRIIGFCGHDYHIILEAGTPGTETDSTGRHSSTEGGAGAGRRNRTDDLLILNQLLYRCESGAAFAEIGSAITRAVFPLT